MIALFCDEIKVLSNTVVGPCDAQLFNENLKHHSVKSIIATVEYKKEHNEPIKELWYAAYVDAIMCQTRQRKLIEKLSDKYDNETLERIHDEFSSGKHNHDKIFSMDDLTEIGLRVEVIDRMPQFIKNTLDHYLD